MILRKTLFIFLRACLNLTLHYFESYFGGYFSVFMDMAGYVTSENRKTDRKQTQNKPDKKLLRKI